jgi:hypothetical protein
MIVMRYGWRIVLEPGTLQTLVRCRHGQATLLVRDLLKKRERAEFLVPNN